MSYRYVTTNNLVGKEKRCSRNCVIYTQRVEVIESYQERRDCADQRIADFIYECGFIPIPVPNNELLAEHLVNAIQPVGIVLTGGNSLVKYGGNAPERDAMDKKLIDISIDKQIPLYGFCRGMQSILDYFENELENVKGHVAVRHMVSACEQFYEVNSYHNQACLKLKEECGLLITAQSEDKVIEAVCHKKYPMLGTMWHPEREKIWSQRDIDQISKLFNKGRR